MAEAAAVTQTKAHGFVRGLGLLDSTMIVAGSNWVRHFPVFVLELCQSPTSFFNY